MNTQLKTVEWISGGNQVVREKIRMPKADHDEIIKGRKKETESYGLNVLNFEYIIDQLPSSLPKHLEQFAHLSIRDYKDKTGKGNPEVCHFLDNASYADILKVCDFQYRKELEYRIVIEKVEQRRTQLSLDAVQVTIDPIEPV